MFICKVTSSEFKWYQQIWMVCDCIYDWRRLNNINYTNYHDIMNSETYIYNYEHNCYVAKTYHFNPNKW